MPDALSHYRARQTPQSEQADPREAKNNAGGFVYTVPEMARVHRFLTLGVDKGTFYVKEPKLARDNAGVVVRLAEASDPRLIEHIREISASGRAPRQNPALFSLAAAAGLGSDEYRQAAWDAVPDVARTGSHLAKFAGYFEQFHGWGPQAKRGLQRWYTSKEPSEAAYQMLKYKKRYGFRQRDLLRLAHLQGADNPTLTPVQIALFRYFTLREVRPDLAYIPLVAAARAAHATRKVSEWVNLIQANPSLTWEMLPSEALARAEVWEALMFSGTLPPGALIRELPRLTRLGMLTPLGGSGALARVERILTSTESLKRARVHPMEMLLAAKVYAGGHSLEGKSTWSPVSRVTEALNAGFFGAFGAVEPSGKRVMINTDTSGSMSWAIAGFPMTAAEAVAAMSLVTARTEREWGLFGFSSHTYSLRVGPGQRLDDMLRAIRDATGGSTDCAAPMIYARQNRLKVDTFQVWTDNETWYGDVHPWQALEDYRQASGIDARLQVCAVAPTEFSIADPSDPRQLDVSGLDSAVPKLLADHGRGDI